MRTVETIPFELDPIWISQQLRLHPGGAGFTSIEELVGFTRPLIDLRAVYDVAYVGSKGEGTVEIELLGDKKVIFKSRILRANLEKAQKIFPYIITVGPDLERAAVSSGDLLKQYYLEEIANIVLESGVSGLTSMLGERWGFSRLSNMSPGSLEDWPITEQTELFNLLGDTDKTIGVRLTESLLMVPRKSISGILFPSEEDFHACQLCPRDRCPSRKAPYDEREAARIRQD